VTRDGRAAGIVTSSDVVEKVVLTANMIASRFEIIAILYIFFSSLRT
jgi:hypothetical protein